MRTPDQIVARIAALENDPADFFGFIRGDLVDYLPFDLAKSHLKDGVTPEVWAERHPNQTAEGVEAEMRDYMPFAWEKANNCRGLSAVRSINHMQAWLWLLGMEKAASQIEDYSLYGKPQLRAICEHFGWDWRAWDSGKWKHGEDDDGDGPPETVFTLYSEVSP